MHSILIDTAAVSGASWSDALRHGALPRLSRALRLAEIIAEETPRADAEAAWLSPAERWVAAALGLETDEHAPWGALAALGDGLQPGDAPWALALPVHLQLGRESLSLADPAGLRLHADESAALLDAVRPLLVDADWRIEQPQPSRWLLSHRSLVDVCTADPSRAVARNVASWMPGGAAARPWRRLLTEIQMVWQHHAVNEARLRDGAPDINTVWLHGCGVLPPELRNPFVLDGDAPGALWARALWAGLPRLPATRHPHRLRLVQPSATRADERFTAELAALDAHAAQAIDAALQQHAAVRVVLAGELRWIAFELRRARRWQFWRRADAHVLLERV